MRPELQPWLSPDWDPGPVPEPPALQYQTPEWSPPGSVWQSLTELLPPPTATMVRLTVNEPLRPPRVLGSRVAIYARWWMPKKALDEGLQVPMHVLLACEFPNMLHVAVDLRDGRVIGCCWASPYVQAPSWRTDYVPFEDRLLHYLAQGG